MKCPERDGSCSVYAFFKTNVRKRAKAQRLHAPRQQPGHDDGSLIGESIDRALPAAATSGSAGKIRLWNVVSPEEIGVTT
jgi:hypothetical protein